ncbi:DJ-1/PfpI family protein [Rhizobium sp. 16-449-1b]|uniref:DJ-1/PfpI family protein n=1 Tax=Rhizobium sp. 16-449-1b TaxID=2819989 RepID=UPI001ADBC684|nr:DJ-1/PfpI family protein [Rhizobium sp. 16-449-1b]
MVRLFILWIGLVLSVGSASAQTLTTEMPNPETGRAVSEHATVKSKRIGIVVFPEFETLDVFGPIQMWGRLPDHEVVLVAQKAGPVRSAQGVEAVATYSFENAPQFDILMVPGGIGTRQEVNNQEILDFVRKQDQGTTLTTSVCTGAAILAKAGLLDGHKATTNKLAFSWATSQSNKVNWVGHARWVEDGKYITSSGVSAGTDMSLAVVEKVYGREAADRSASFAEYTWNDKADHDPFAVDAGPGSKK